jgi:hypothetical protein
MSTTPRARELRIRRMAERQGLALRKSRRRDPHALDYASWWVIDPALRRIVAGDRWGIDLDSVESWLRTSPAERA